MKAMAISAAAWPRLVGAASVLGALVVWELASRADLINHVIIGSPSMVLAAAISDGATFLAAFRVTIAEILIAITLAWSSGLLVGAFSGRSRMLTGVAGPILSGLNAIPLVLIYPLLMAWIGIGSPSKIAYGALSGFFPIASSTFVAVKSLDGRFMDMARAMGASRTQMLLKVVIPMALPSIVAGLRIGTSLIVIGVIVSEMLASTDGIGFWISYHRSLFNSGHVYLGILLALSIAFGINAALTRLERHYDAARAEKGIKAL